MKKSTELFTNRQPVTGDLTVLNKEIVFRALLTHDLIKCHYYDIRLMNKATGRCPFALAVEGGADMSNIVISTVSIMEIVQNKGATVAKNATVQNEGVAIAKNADSVCTFDNEWRECKL
ncbi:MAG: hypothetical protein FWG92_05020 [Leptospirales bacterium]|nr:hypothetical protein [Leptospirales bacterium]